MGMNTLKNALPFIAGALADKIGVEVVSGDAAKTDGHTITLPPLDGEDQKVRIKALGFIAHESRHVKDTDMEVWLREVTTPLRKDVINSLEDIRIERDQGKEFPGCATYLKDLLAVMIEEGHVRARTPDEHPALIMCSWMRHKLRHDVLGQTCIASVLEQSEAVFRATIPQGMATRLEALMYEVTDCNSTQDVADLSNQIIRMIEDEEKKEEEQEKKQDESQKDQSQPEQSGQTPGGNGAEQEEGEGQSQPQSAGAGAPSGQKPTSPTQGQGASNEMPSSEVLRKILSAGEETVEEGLGEMVAKQLNAIADPNKNLRVFNSSRTGSLGPSQPYDFKVRGTVNAMRVRLHTLLQAQTRTRTVRSSQGTRLSSKHLHEARLGGNVFEKKFRGESVDTAVSILIDKSGSMSNRINLAGEAAYALASALDSVLNVKVAAGIFPTQTGVDYLSWFGERPATRALNFAHLTAHGGTPMSDSLARATIDLLRQPQKRKIQLIITDGQPAYEYQTITRNGTPEQYIPVDQTRTVVASAQAAGIEVMGIGIGVDLGHLFDTWCSIDSIEALPGQMFGMMQNSLLKKVA